MTREQIEEFCRERFGSEVAVEPLAGDASTRCYYRLRRGEASHVLMDAAGRVDPKRDPFLKATELLAGLGLPVPKVFEVFPGEGLLLLEDLGDLLLQRRLTDCSERERERLYNRALEHLLVLHSSGTVALEARPDHPAALEALDLRRFTFELGMTLAYYVKGTRLADLPRDRRTVVEDWFKELSAEVASFGRVLCHRDYHARNLMVYGGELAILDHQDARWGPVTYDLASLLRDSYVALPARFVDRLVERFRRLMIERLNGNGFEALAEGLDLTLRDPVEFRRRFDLTCLQRNLKALGTFGYQASVKKNTVYLRYIVPTCLHVRANFERFPEYSEVFEILDEAGALPEEEDD